MCFVGKVKLNFTSTRFIKKCTIFEMQKFHFDVLIILKNKYKQTLAASFSAYHVAVRTKLWFYAGTDAGVWIRVLGTKGSTEDIQLEDPEKNEFVAGK